MWLISLVAIVVHFAKASTYYGPPPSSQKFSKVYIVDDFADTKPEFVNMKAAIEAADYIAFDNELGGFINNKAGFNDTPEQYYRKLADTVEKYSLLQFGFTTVKRNGDVYEEHAWSIYVKDDIVTCNPSSAEFLCKAGFDWSKLFQKGMSMAKLSEFIRGTLFPAKKPLVCHNCLGDVLHLLKYFSSHGVPQDLVQFSSAAESTFVFYDTKVMFMEYKPETSNADSNLSACYQHFNGPFVGPAHGAGVDSLMTGRVFAYLLEKKSLADYAPLRNSLMLDSSRYYNLVSNKINIFPRISVPHNRHNSREWNNQQPQPRTPRTASD